jgi:hypothetical protein
VLAVVLVIFAITAYNFAGNFVTGGVVVVVAVGGNQ